MRPWLLLLCAALGLPGRGKDSRQGYYPTIRDKRFIRRCLDAHNRLRARVRPPAANMRYMTWDLALARTARAWARKCVFEHNPFRKLKGSSHPDPQFNPPGENLWIGNAFRRPFNPTNSIHSWHSEVAYYNYQNNTCSRTCGRYTQIVWDTTYKLGCAVVFCHNLGRHKNIENFVCNYGPAGNNPRRPYETGQPCSACSEGDMCENKLCRNSQRDNDNSKRYTRWFPPWEHRVICDQSCIAVLVLRPSLLFLAFVAAYCLQQYYPGLNCKNDLYDIM